MKSAMSSAFEQTEMRIIICNILSFPFNYNCDTLDLEPFSEFSELLKSVNKVYDALSELEVLC